MTGLIIIIAVVLLIMYFAFKRAKAKVDFNYVEAEKNIKEALKKLQTEDDNTYSVIAPEATPTVVIEEEVKPPTMSAKKKKSTKK